MSKLMKWILFFFSEEIEPTERQKIVMMNSQFSFIKKRIDMCNTLHESYQANDLILSFMIDFNKVGNIIDLESELVLLLRKKQDYICKNM